MTYDSPFLNPTQYVSKVSGLSSEAIAIDEGVGRAVREAKDFAAKYAGDFSLVSELSDVMQKFEPRWSTSLQSSRDAASALTGWLKRFSGVFLAMINDVQSQQDAKDVVTEFQSFLGAGHPLDKYPLDGTPGPKKAFQEIQDLVDKESSHIISVMQDSKEWQKAIKELKEKLSALQQGVGKVEEALQKYATRLA